MVVPACCAIPTDGRCSHGCSHGKCTVKSLWLLRSTTSPAHGYDKQACSQLIATDQGIGSGSKSLYRWSAGAYLADARLLTTLRKHEGMLMK